MFLYLVSSAAGVITHSAVGLRPTTLRSFWSELCGQLLRSSSLQRTRTFGKSGLLPQVLGGGEGKGKGNHTSSPPPQTQSEPLSPSGVQQLSLQLRTTSCVPGQRSAWQAEASLLLCGAQSQHPPQVSQDQVLHAARLLGASQSSGFWELRSVGSDRSCD